MRLRLFIPLTIALFVHSLLVLRPYYTTESTIGLGLHYSTILQFFSYAVIAHILCVFFKKQLKFDNWRSHAFALAAVFTLIFAIFFELLRWYLGYSQWIAWPAMFINTLGCFAGIGIFHLLYRNIF